MRVIIKNIGLLLLVSFGLKVTAQPPVITGLSISSGTINQEIVITGNNFSASTGNMKVLFGSSLGTVTEATGSSLKALVPAGATFNNIQVINTSSNLSAFSNALFSLSYNGSQFSESNFDAEISSSNAKELFDLELADFNNDGKPDVAVTQVESAIDLLIFKNTSTPGNVSFTRLSGSTNPELNVNTVTSNIACGDLNGDGLIDLVVTKSGNPRNVIFVFKNISSGGNIKFSAPQSLFLATEDIAKRVEIRDLDLDGKPEIIVTNTFTSMIHIFRNASNSGNVQFTAIPVDLDVPGSSTTNGLVVEDLNNDGKPDIVTNPFIGSDIYISRNKSGIGSISFDTPQKITVAGNLNNLAAGDLNGDGKIDLTVTKTIQGQIAVLLNNTTDQGNSFSFQATSFSTDAGPWGINTTDLNGDGKPDILVGLRDTKTIDIFINGSSGTTATFTKFQVSSANNTRNVKGGDIDGDGKPDISFTSFDGSISNYSMSVIRNANCMMPDISPAGPLTICAGSVRVLQATKGIGVTYKWEKDNVAFKTNSEDTINITEPGVYKVTATSESGSCEFLSNAVIVTQGTGNAPELPVINNNGPFCQGTSIILTTDDVTDGVYSWTGPNDYSSSDKDITIPDASVMQAGEYNLQVTVGDCSSNVASSVVDVIAVPDFEILSSGPAQICNGNTIQLSVAQVTGYTYQWYKNDQPVSGETGNAISVSQEGTYNVELTQTSTSCSVFSANSIAISIVDPPVSGFTNPGPTCIETSLNFENTSTVDPDTEVIYTWNFGDGSPPVNDENPAHAYTTAGSYQVQLMVGYTSGACSDNVTKSVSVSDNPSFEIIQSPASAVCEGDSVQLSISASFPSYEWDSGEVSRELTVTTAGDYEVTVRNASNCTASQTKNVTFLDRPEVTATSNTGDISPGESAQLEAEGAVLYSWSPGEFLNDSTIANPLATISEQTLFTVTGENASGCTDTATVLIAVREGNAIFVNPMKLFSPNGDGIDDEWIIENIEIYPECTIMIFNGNGSTVYEASPYNNDWNAVYKGKDLPEGAYFFVIHSPGKDPRTGSVTVIR